MIFIKGGAVMIIDKMDYIFAIAKEQNLTRAAKRLFVAQSTLTMYLNRVEAELGVKLFDRSKTPILPTPAGALCIEELKKIRQIETRLSAKLQQMAHPEETLNVGIGLMHSAAWMPQLLPLFHEIYPDVRINLIEQGDELLLQSLRADDADVVIGGMPVGTQDVFEKLALEQLLLIVPRKFHLAPPWVYAGNSYKNPYEITPQQLQGLPLIMPSSANDLGGITNQALEHFDIQPKSVITVSSMQTAAMLVSQDMGYLFTSPVFLSMQAEQLGSKIVYCTMQGIPDTRRIVAVYNPDTRKKEMIRQFLKLLRTVMFQDQPGIFPLTD